MKVKVISLPYIFQVLYVLCFTWTRYQVSVYRTIGTLVPYAKTKTQISCAVTAQLISAFVFALRIVQSLYFLNPKFKASSYLLWLHSPVCVGPGPKPRRPVFSQRGSYILCVSIMMVCSGKTVQKCWLCRTLLVINVINTYI